MGLKDLTKDDLAEQRIEQNKSNYVQPGFDDFDKFFRERPEEWYIDSEIKPSMEYVFSTLDFVPGNSNVTLTCFTTIDTRTDKARSKGADAIRLVAFYRPNMKKLTGDTKTLRIATWRKNLSGKIDNMMNEGRKGLKVCDECGSIMIIREGEYGKFYGCTRYPDCSNTVKYNE